MKGKEVYVVIVDDVYDYEAFGIRSFVYEHEADAKAKVAELKASAISSEMEWYVLDESDFGFSYYEDGKYTCNHYDVSIIKSAIL
jgi:hypothetical protein